MQINFVYDASVSSAPAAFKTGLQQAANILDSAILNPITVNIQVGWGEIGGSAFNSNSALAEGGTENGVDCTYSQLVNALDATAVANNCSYIAANLLKSDPTNGGSWGVGQAQAAILNISDPYSSEIAGNVGFARDINWAFDPTKGIGPNQYDFVGAAMHEITHALGREGFSPPNIYNALNLYTYASPGRLQLQNGAGEYFSIDGGATNLNYFDAAPDGDSADWVSTLSGDSFGAGYNGTLDPLSFVDLQVMEALGYKIAPSYQLTGDASVNEGNHVILNISTVGVAAGSIVKYSISGISASRLISGSLTGTATIGANGTGTIDLAVVADHHTDGAATAMVTIADNLASDSVVVNDISLTSGDTTTAPLGSTFSPAIGSVNDGITDSIIITFDKPIQAGSGKIVLETSNGKIVQTYNVASSSAVSISNDALIIHPTKNLSYATEYKLLIPAGAVTDMFLNKYEGESNYNFTTTNTLTTTSLVYIIGSKGPDNLTYTGTGNFKGTGTNKANVITGGVGNDTLDGGGENDTLTGDRGNDTFVFDTKLNATSNVDTITDFTSGSDAINLSKKIFTVYKTVGADLTNDFISGTSPVAVDKTDHFLYDTTTGNLYYDADGSGRGAAVQFATLTGHPTLVASDLHIV